MEHVAKLKKLKYLNLDNTAVDDDGLQVIATLPELGTLTLNETGITDDGLEHLQACKSLKKLEVRLTAVGKKAVAQLKEAIPGLEVAFDE